MPLHPLNNFKIQKHYHDGVDSRNNSIKIKDMAHVVNLDEYE